MIKNKNEIMAFDYLELHKKLCVLKEIAFDYSGKTIDNIIVQMESRIHELDKYVTKE